MLKVLQRNELFNDIIEVVVCPRDRLPKAWRGLIKPSSAGSCCKFKAQDGFRWFVWLSEWRNDNEALALLVHELTHYVLRAIPEHGMQTSYAVGEGAVDTELPAYMLQMLTREVSDKLEVERAKIEKKRAQDAKRRSKGRRKDS